MHIATNCYYAAFMKTTHIQYRHLVRRKNCMFSFKLVKDISHLEGHVLKINEDNLE